MKKDSMPHVPWNGVSGSYAPSDYYQWFSMIYDDEHDDDIRLHDVVVTGDLIFKCLYCGQWGAARSACAHCGAPID